MLWENSLGIWQASWRGAHDGARRRKHVTAGPETLSATAGENVAPVERVVGDTDEGLRMEPLVQAGRLKEATAAPKGWVRAGAPLSSAASAGCRKTRP